MRFRFRAATLLRPTRFRVALFVLLVGAASAYLMYLTPEKRAVRNRLSEADDQSRAAIDTRIKPLTELFARGRQGAPAFAKEALSWSGKWALVKGVAVDGAHRTFLADAF